MGDYALPVGYFVCIAWGLLRRRDLTPGLAHVAPIVSAAGDAGTLA